MSEEQKPVGDEPKAKKKRKPRTVKMSEKQKKLVKAIVTTTGNVSEAGRIAGYGTPQAAHRALKTIGMRFESYLEKHGMTDDYLAEKCLRPALEAMQTKFFSKKGVVIDTREVVAWGPRIQTLDMVFKIKGAYKQPENADVTPRSAPVVINLAFLDPRRAEAILAAQLPSGSDR